MNELAEQNLTATAADTDLVTAIRRVLQESPEPLTLSKIRSALPTTFRSLGLESLAETLQRQVAANLLVQYPKYRSPQDRFWDRPMPLHIAQLLRSALENGPLAVSELRRKLPDYAKTQAEVVLEQEVAQGRLHRHPPANSRSGPRFGAEPADPKTFLSTELGALFTRLERLGFTRSQLRQGALDLLHDEEWGPPTTPAPTATATTPPSTAATNNPQTPGYQWSEERAPTPERTDNPQNQQR
jgi:hypothetical protein